MSKKILRQKNNNKIKSSQLEELVIDTDEINQQGKQSFWLLTVLSMISAFCGYMGFSDGFEINSSLVLVLIITVFFTVLTQIILTKAITIKVGIPAVVIGLVAYVLITLNWLINGITLIINQIITYINVHKAQMHIKYVVSHKTETLDIAIATVGLCAIYTIIISVLIKYKRTYLCGILLLGATMGNILAGGENQIFWVSASLICTIAIIYISNIRVLKIPKRISFGSAIIASLVVITALFAIFAKYSGIRSVDDLKDEIVYRTGNVIYGKSDFPEGQFKRFDNYEEETDEVRLTVEMTDPVPLHLKGYVGCEYTEKGWKDNDANIYGGQNLGMMEWFLDQGFYPLTQPAYYMGYSRNDGRNTTFDKVGNSSIHIVNNTASKKYQYISENLLDMSGLIDPKQDVNFVETDIFTEDEYWYDILYFTEDNYLDFPSQLWFSEENQGTNQQQRFIKAENYYHGFVSNYYLAIPEEEKEILAANIPECSNNVSDAIITVRSYLKSQMEYSTKCAKYDPDTNYLQQILLEDRKGYSAHFSTVATLMFRYYGVPARYVEGYWSPNDEEKEKVELSNSHAHAWVEVYIKGIGFVPVEVTPGYYQEELVGSHTIHKKDNPLNQGGQGSTGTKKDDEELIQITWKMILTAVLGAILIGIVIFIMILVVRRIVVVKKRNKGLSSQDDYVVVATASKYIDDVSSFAKSNIKQEITEDVRVILEKVKFSKHPLLSNQKDMVVACMNEVVDRIWKKQSLVRKLIMMFWKCYK